MFAAFSASAAAKSPAPARGKGKADLKVTELKFLRPSPPPHIVVGTDGDVHPFAVLVRTTNVGNAPAGDISTTTLTAEGQGETRFRVIGISPVGRLEPGRSAVRRIFVDHLTVPLGFTKIEATADAHGQVAESKHGESNNVVKLRPVPTIPFQWNVSIFTTAINSPAGNTATLVQDPFTFILKEGGSGQFVYEPHGDLRSAATGTLGGCAITGQMDSSVSAVPGNNGLFLDTNLEHYEGTIAASQLPPWFATVVCSGGVTFQYQDAFQDLDTFIGTEGVKPAMQPGDTTLKGSFTDASLFTTWTWSFAAAIPK
jgi:hypothetical protein